MGGPKWGSHAGHQFHAINARFHVLRRLVIPADFLFCSWRNITNLVGVNRMPKRQLHEEGSLGQYLSAHAPTLLVKLPHVFHADSNTRAHAAMSSKLRTVRRRNIEEWPFYMRTDLFQGSPYTARKALGVCLIAVDETLRHEFSGTIIHDPPLPPGTRFQ
jgi:hypothetical protein